MGADYMLLTRGACIFIRDSVTWVQNCYLASCNNWRGRSRATGISLPFSIESQR